ncbi:hypothetical protein GY21_10120 [Cryobacterium roopkundense]|uniref:AB hydrolase-1 domain-containing protein n=1 Tax=Cryobacterium roopkundense TaxID=1001240 RepID=A0A099J8Y2_9MICO|nr:hypothetical protein [Cryobacterium roopkundense]KGJ74879.1 hypothetical protein GY21_10120 [Cryobacterium roopkundense]MBB5640618.1 hypothetical protein [Cryobacterium roopkundense]
MGRVAALGSAAARVGVAQVIGLLGFDYDTLPPRAREKVRAGSATADYVRSYLDEFVQGGASGAEAASLDDFGSKPLVVLTAGVGGDPVHSAAQEHLASLSSNSVHRVIDGASHAALILKEEYAASTTQAILEVVESLRNGIPLN